MVTKFARTTILTILAVLAINSAASALVYCPAIAFPIGGGHHNLPCGGPIHVGPITR